MTPLKPIAFQPYDGLLDQAQVETVDGRPAGTLTRSPLRHGSFHYLATTAKGDEVFAGIRIGVALEMLSIFAAQGSSISHPSAESAST